MNRELEIWKFAAERIEKKQRVLILIVVSSKGSSPGRPGFKMAVSDEGLVGSIGGGVMEVSMVEEALAQIGRGIITSQGVRLVSRVHRENSPDSSGMICSGEQKVILFELSEAHLETVNSMLETVSSNNSGLLEISYLEDESRETEMQQPGLRDSDPGFGFRFYDPAADGAREERLPQFEFRDPPETEGGFLYREIIGHQDQLFIVGGGHCALALSELMSKLDFNIRLFDDRPGLNTISKNEFAQAIRIIESYGEIERFIPPGANNYVVVMTIGYKFDKLVIKKLLQKDFAYFGVLGSRAKMAVLLRELENEGFPRDRLDKIHTPIGIQIGSRTPFEIAVSIAAEIIAVRNRKG